MIQSDILNSIEPFVRLCQKPYREFIDNHSSPEAYAEILFQTWYYVKETVPTIENVISRCPHHPLVDKLRVRAQEEIGHDMLLLNDLKLIDHNVQLSPSPYVTKFVKIEKSLTNLKDPVSALYGHIAFLECWPATTEWVNYLSENFKIPQKATSAFLVHASEDIKHMESAIREMNHPSINKTRVTMSAIEIAKLFANHWKWMNNTFK